MYPCMADKNELPDTDRIKAWLEGPGGLMFAVFVVILVIGFIYVAVTSGGH